MWSELETSPERDVTFEITQQQQNDNSSLGKRKAVTDEEELMSMDKLMKFDVPFDEYFGQ